MDELLGFMVLTGPLFPMLIWLIVCVLLVVFVVRPKGSGLRRGAIKTMVFVTVLVLPFADGIVGHYYLKHLCETQDGFKVFQTVELPDEYWDKDGAPKFIAANGFVDMSKLPGDYQWERIEEPYINNLITIDIIHWRLMDLEANETLGERITYMRKYGWLRHFSVSPSIGASCRDIYGEANRSELLRNEVEQERRFFSSIFKESPINSSLRGTQ